MYTHPYLEWKSGMFVWSRGSMLNGIGHVITPSGAVPPATHVAWQLGISRKKRAAASNPQKESTHSGVQSRTQQRSTNLKGAHRRHPGNLFDTSQPPFHATRRRTESIARLSSSSRRACPYFFFISGRPEDLGLQLGQYQWTKERRSVADASASAVAARPPSAFHSTIACIPRPSAYSNLPFLNHTATPAIDFHRPLSIHPSPIIPANP